MAEMLGREGGASKGKGGSMHYYSHKNNFYGGNGIVGAQIPVGTGLGFALKYKNRKNIAVAMYGDGASNQGQLFESSNMAKIWNLPVVYFCENNLYGMGTSIERASNETKLHRRLGQVPGIECDGLNIFSVKAITKYAKENCPELGPLCVNAITYRYHGHSMSDPGITYRTRDEVNYIRKEKDCIDYLKRIMLENGMVELSEIKAMEKEVKKEIDADVKKAQAQPIIGMEQLTVDIYDDELQKKVFIRGPVYEESLAPEGM